MSADTVASDPAGIFAGSADGANRCYQTLPSTERCALAALRACYPDAAGRSAHRAAETIAAAVTGEPARPQAGECRPKRMPA
jgi:hypothetical protein